MSEKIIFILVAALVFIVLLLVGVVIYLVNRLLKEKSMTQDGEHSTEPSRSSRKGVDREQLKRMAEAVETSYCVNHPQDHGQGLCAICNETFCEECIKEHEGLTFCRPHFRLFISHDWQAVETIKTTPETPETAFPIYDFKKFLWEKEGLPAVISTHYKINIDTDTIESYVKLLVRTDEYETLAERYQTFKH